MNLKCLSGLIVAMSLIINVKAQPGVKERVVEMAVPHKLVTLSGEDSRIIFRAVTELEKLAAYNSDQRNIQNYEVEIYRETPTSVIQVYLIARPRAGESVSTINTGGHYAYAKSIILSFEPDTLRLVGTRESR